MGGRESSEWGEYWAYRPTTPREKPLQGLVFKDEWPWGSKSPHAMPEIDEYAITPFGKFSMPQEVGLTKANGYGIHDMIGNVREYVGAWHKGNQQNFHFGWLGDVVMQEVWTYGGSVSNGFGNSNDSWINPKNLMSDMGPVSSLNGDEISATGNPDVGFRPVRFTF